MLLVDEVDVAEQMCGETIEKNFEPEAMKGIDCC